MSLSDMFHASKIKAENQRLAAELEEKNKLLKARTEQIQSMKRVEELYEEAIKAMRNYSGQGEQDEC